MTGVVTSNEVTHHRQLGTLVGSYEHISTGNCNDWCYSDSVRGTNVLYQAHSKQVPFLARPFVTERDEQQTKTSPTAAP